MNNKKDKERECIELVQNIEVSEETKRILKEIFIGEVEEAECPDFMITNEIFKEIVGIEHFRIDHQVVKKKNGDVASSGIMNLKEVQKTYYEWKDKVTGDEIPEGAINAIMDIIANNINRKYKATFNNFKLSFDYSLKKHIRHLKSYWNKLDEVRKEKGYETIKFAFLMEIYTDFSDLFLDKYKKVVRNENGLMPFFTEIVEVLENIDNSKVNFVVFLLKNYLNTKVKVVAVDLKDIRKSLKAGDEELYVYVGTDRLLAPFEIFDEMNEKRKSFEYENKQIRLNFTSTSDLNFERWMPLLFDAVYQAQYNKKLNNAIACDYMTEFVLYVYGDHIVWDRTSNNIHKPYFRFIKPQSVERRCQEFDIRFVRTREEKG